MDCYKEPIYIFNNYLLNNSLLGKLILSTSPYSLLRVSDISDTLSFDDIISYVLRYVMDLERIWIFSNQIQEIPNPNSN